MNRWWVLCLAASLLVYSAAIMQEKPKRGEQDDVKKGEAKQDGAKKEETKTGRGPGAVNTLEQALKKLKVGMPEKEVFEIMNPISLKVDTVHLGGTGRVTHHFLFLGQGQVLVSISGPPKFVVDEIYQFKRRK